MAFLEASWDNVNWFDLPDPGEDNYNPTYTHEEKSKRDAKRILHRDIIRRNMAKVLCGWNELTGEEGELLQSLYDKDFFYLKFTDRFNNRVVKKVYAGPVNGQVKYANPKNYKIVKYSTTTMNFVEY